MAVLYVFNPWHDLALAAQDAHFTPPLNARRFARDAAPLTWYAAASPPSEEAYLLCETLPDVPGTALPEGLRTYTAVDGTLLPWVDEGRLSRLPLRRIVAWGWDALLCKRLQDRGVDPKLLPGPETLARIRDFSHRKWALEAHHFLCQTLEGRPWQARCPLALPGTLCTALDQVQAFASSRPQAVLKAPWSGSGKGLFWTRGGLDPKGEGWCRNLLSRQGAVVGETRLEGVQDFALEFVCGAEGVRFVGYSLFHTQGGAYAGNLLCSQEQLRARLLDLIPAQALEDCRQSLTDFLTARFAGAYEGYLGVDMLVFRHGRGVGLHPVVEINARMTMGLLALQCYERFRPVFPQGTGLLQVRYSPDPARLHPFSPGESRTLDGRLPAARYAVECLFE